MFGALDFGTVASFERRFGCFTFDRSVWNKFRSVSFDHELLNLTQHKAKARDQRDSTHMYTKYLDYHISAYPVQCTLHIDSDTTSVAHLTDVYSVGS